MATDQDAAAADANHDVCPGNERDPRDAGSVSPVEVSVVPIETLTPLADNPRSHSPRGINFIAASMERSGAARSGVIDEHKVILAGNGMREAALRAGFREAIVIKTDGTRPVFVQRDGLSTTQKARVIIDDNRASELSSWNSHLLEYAARDPSIEDEWTTPEWRTVAGPERQGTTGRTDPDLVVEPRSTSIARGDLFRLGAHHLLCGDATNPKDVRRLLGDTMPPVMATDPPWGVNYDGGWRVDVDGGGKHALDRVTNDDRVDWTDAFRLFTGDVAYVWHAGIHAGEVGATMRATGLVVRAQIVWAKQHFAMSRGDYHHKHEPCWYAVREGRSSRWQGDRTQTTVWAVANLNPFGGNATGENASTSHSTQKPVALFEPPVLNHTEPGEALYDPFAGSGTALIAAEKLGRVCYAMEITPLCVQSIIDRWEAFTGQQAVKVEGQ